MFFWLWIYIYCAFISLDECLCVFTVHESGVSDIKRITVLPVCPLSAALFIQWSTTSLKILYIPIKTRFPITSLLISLVKFQQTDRVHTQFSFQKSDGGAKDADGGLCFHCILTEATDKGHGSGWHALLEETTAQARRGHKEGKVESLCCKAAAQCKLETDFSTKTFLVVWKNTFLLIQKAPHWGEALL